MGNEDDRKNVSCKQSFIAKIKCREIERCCI